MKHILLFIVSFYMSTPTAAFAQQQDWTFAGGPWHSAFSSDIAIGYRDDGQPVMYAVRLSSQSLAKTTDAGETWIHLPLPEATIVEVYSIACEENNPDVLYLGISTCVWCGDVYKSTDGGLQWEHVLPTGSAVPTKIIISQVDPQVIYVGVQRFGGGEWTSLWYSEDGGANWSDHLDGGFPNSVQVSNIVLDPTDLSYRYVAVSFPPNEAGFWKTENAGQLWTRINEGLTSPHMTALAIDPEILSTLYSSVHNFQTNKIEIFRSDDRGEHWSATPFSATGGITTALMVVERQPNTLLAATDLHGIFRSTDYGGTWSPSNTNIYDLQVNTMAIDQRDGDKVFIGTSAAFYRSDNGGMTWSEKTRGIARSGITSLAVRDGFIVTNGEAPITFNRSSDFGQSWITVYGVDYSSGDNNQIALSHGTPTKVLATRRVSPGDAQTDSASILSPVLRSSLVLQSWNDTSQVLDYVHAAYRSLDAGFSWERLPRIFDGRSATLMNDPNNSSVWYNVSNFAYPPDTYPLMRSTDDGVTWQGVYEEGESGALRSIPLSSDPEGCRRICTSESIF